MTNGYGQRRVEQHQLKALESEIHTEVPRMPRVAQIFKNEILLWDQAVSYSLRKRNAEKYNFF